MFARVIFGLLSLLFVAFGQLPDSFNITHQTLQPEGIEYYAGVGFLLGSIFEGTVYVVNDTGAFTAWPKPAPLISAFGLQVDATRGLLHVANANSTSISKILANDFSGPFYSGLVTLNLTTGELVRSVDLSDQLSFANDVAVDSAGYAYVTDAIGGQVWVVSPAGTVGTIIDARFSGGFNIGVNGIDYHPNGYLVVVNSATGKLLKITLPGRVVTETIVTGNLTAGDGIVFNANGDLVVVKNGFFQAALVRSTDNFATARVVETVQLSQNGPATTAAVRGNSVYVVHSAFSPPLPSSYLVEKVTFTTPAPTTSQTQQTTQVGTSQTGTGEGSFTSVVIPSFLLAVFLMFL